jgi:hypothetical protein
MKFILFNQNQKLRLLLMTTICATLLAVTSACTKVEFASSPVSASLSKDGLQSSEPISPTVSDTPPTAELPPVADVPLMTPMPGKNPSSVREPMPPLASGPDMPALPPAMLMPMPSTSHLAPVDLPPPLMSPVVMASACRGTGVLPASFALDSVLVDSGGAQRVEARHILQLSNIDGDVIAIANTINAGILGIHGSLEVVAEEVGQIADIDHDVCAQAQSFLGVVQNIRGHVELSSLGGASDIATLAQINNVGSARVSNVSVNNVHDIDSDLTIINGGIVTEIANVKGDVTLVNTTVLYMHDVPNGKITLDHSQIIQHDSNSVGAFTVIP